MTQSRKRREESFNAVSAGGRLALRSAVRNRFEDATTTLLTAAIRQTLENSLVLNALMMETVRRAKQVQGAASEAERDAGGMGVNSPWWK